MINIEDDVMYLHRLGLLDKLLYDRTTKRNIVWATDAHAELGEAYKKDKEIRAELITGDRSGVIKTRAKKAATQQNSRTRRHGEVFTPLWICRKMNDYADEMWFGRPGVFERGGEPVESVEFPKGKKWGAYVDSRRLEITCGEAPYLVNRYDVATGEEIPVEQRSGILDRKLRVVDENAPSEKEWLKWAFRAFEATYGYELQGDNLVIARVNVFMTFVEYLSRRWNRRPAAKELQRLVKIITWNVWQMDGLTGKTPVFAPDGEDGRQRSLFEGLEDYDAGTREGAAVNCRIFDWRRQGGVEFLALANERGRAK